MKRVKKSEDSPYSKTMRFAVHIILNWGMMVIGHVTERKSIKSCLERVSSEIIYMSII